MLEVKEVKDRSVWENFLATRPETSFLQSWWWGEFYRELGNRKQETGFYRDGGLVGVMLSIVEEAKRGRYLAVPGGPIIDWEDEEVVQVFADEVKRVAKENK